MAFINTSRPKITSISSKAFALMILWSALTVLVRASVVSTNSHQAKDNQQKISGLALRWSGLCRCADKSFTMAVNSAFTTVRVQVISRNDIYRLSQTDRKLLIRGYKLQVTQRFSKNGPSKNSNIYAEAYDNADLCGVRLTVGTSYLLNLSNPWGRSSASIWPNGVFVLDACQVHFGWNSLENWQKEFLWARV